MRYEDARQEIQSGDVLAWRPQSLMGKFISHWTGSPYSHVGVALWLEEYDRLMVLEALPDAGCVLVRSLRELCPFHWVTVPRDEDWDPSWAFSILGKPYSVIDAVTAGLGSSFSRPGFICSELAGHVIKEQGVELPRPSWVPGYIVDRLIDVGGITTAVEKD